VGNSARERRSQRTEKVLKVQLPVLVDVAVFYKLLKRRLGQIVTERTKDGAEFFSIDGAVAVCTV
jgi:hypothetical protein